MLLLSRAVGRFENPGVPVLFGGHNLPPPVEIRLTDLPKSEGDDTPASHVQVGGHGGCKPGAPYKTGGVCLHHTMELSTFIGFLDIASFGTKGASIIYVH